MVGVAVLAASAAGSPPVTAIFSTLATRGVFVVYIMGSGGYQEIEGVPLGVSSLRTIGAEALLSGASPQLRNAATVGGNLLQRTRCAYRRIHRRGAD